jgi:hypothetical protein
VGDLSAIIQIAAQFAAVHTDEFKGLEAMAAAVGIGPPGEPAAEVANGRVNSIQESTGDLFGKHIMLLAMSMPKRKFQILDFRFQKNVKGVNCGLLWNLECGI